MSGNKKKREKELHVRRAEKCLYGRPKKEIFKRDNWRCQTCNSKKNLCIHHKDGKGYTTKAKDRNNKLSNLITLCKSCHTRLHVNIQWKNGSMQNRKQSKKHKKCCLYEYN